MIRKDAAVLALIALGMLVAASAYAETAPKAPQPGAAAPATMPTKLDPKAIDLLKAMSARLAAARAMTFTATSTYESPSRLGPALAYTTLSEVTLQRPDKLRVVSPGDGPASEFYYDGKTMMAYAPAENLVAVGDAPPTIDAALKAAYDVAAIYFPFTDVIVADPYKDMADGLKQAFFMGQSRVVGGVTTDMVAIANDRVFVQLWIGADDKLPRLVRAVYLDDPSRLRQQVEFSKWRLNPEIAADGFASARAVAAPRIAFARPDPPKDTPKPPPAAPPAGKDEPATTPKP